VVILQCEKCNRIDVMVVWCGGEMLRVFYIYSRLFQFLQHISIQTNPSLMQDIILSFAVGLLGLVAIGILAIYHLQDQGHEEKDIMNHF